MSSKPQRSPETRTVEIRWAGGGRIYGLVIPYNQVSPTHRERWLPGSAHWKHGQVKANLMHLPQLDLGLDHRIELRNEPAGLSLNITLNDIGTGRAAQELVKSGILSGLSAEFIAEREHRDAQGIRVIEQAEVIGVGLVDRPSFPSAQAEARGERRAKLRRARMWL